MPIKTIAFDADDTLWINEPYFNQAQEVFVNLFQNVNNQEKMKQLLYDTQIKNLPLYGYGIKGFVLAMIETATIIFDKNISSCFIQEILKIGNQLLNKPVELIDGVSQTLDYLHKKYHLIVATKGDLKDQHRKLHESGLGRYFHHIEVLVDKNMIDYQKMLHRIQVKPSEFLMIGNSLKSDVVPVLELGGKAVHIPFETTWAHEMIDYKIQNKNFYELQRINQLIDTLKL